MSLPSVQEMLAMQEMIAQQITTLTAQQQAMEQSEEHPGHQTELRRIGEQLDQVQQLQAMVVQLQAQTDARIAALHQEN